LTTKQDFFRSPIDSLPGIKANKQIRDAQAQKGKAQQKSNKNKRKK